MCQSRPRPDFHDTTVVVDPLFEIRIDVTGEGEELKVNLRHGIAQIRWWSLILLRNIRRSSTGPVTVV